MWRVPEGPEGLAAVPVGGGGAWPGFETTRRAKLAARTARGRAAAHGAARPSRRLRPTAPETPAASAVTACLQLLCQALFDGAVALVAEDFEEDAAEED